jgi:hypothetical protein
MKDEIRVHVRAAIIFGHAGKIGGGFRRQSGVGRRAPDDCGGGNALRIVGRNGTCDA